MLASFGEVPLQAMQMWVLVRKREYPPMGGDGSWVINWPVFDQLWLAEHPATHGMDRADALEAMVTCEREANSDPKTWPEVFGFGAR